jgi:hypothetical protein
MDNSETGCCPRFNPKPWNEKKIIFKDKLFVKDRIKSFFHMPLNFGSLMKKNMPLVEKALPEPFFLMVDENSLWGGDLYLEVTKDIPGATMVRMNGTFLTKVFEGPYKNMGKWIKEMEEYVKSKGNLIKKLYFYYTTCPKCAKKLGENYVVILAKI